MTIPTKKEIMDFSPINTNGKEDLPAYTREAFTEIKKAFDTRLITAITGLRRVGKTTLMKQLLDKNSFFFSFDEKKYTNTETLKAVIETFLQESDKPTIALDEIFRVDDWAGVLKRYHDQKKARFIVSGSSALMIKKGVESLSGRLRECYLPPLGFSEYLDLSGVHAEKTALDRVFNVKKMHREDLEGFFINGSFPEIVGMDEHTAKEYIKTSTIEKIIFDDIPATFGIEHPSKLYDLLRLCATNSSRLFTEVNFAEAIQMSRHAVSDYLLYLTKAYLVDVRHSLGSFQKALKKQKKVFAKTASIYNAIAENTNTGQCAETAVYDKLSAKKVSFYTDSQKREVDFITEIPIEVKYQSTITGEDTKNIRYYMEKHKKKHGIVITKDLFDERETDGLKITFIPLDVFLLVK